MFSCVLKTEHFTTVMGSDSDILTPSTNASLQVFALIVICKAIINFKVFFNSHTLIKYKSRIF